MSFVKRKITEGAYQKSAGYEFPPVRHSLMNNVVADLTMEEILSLPEIVTQYNASMDAWRVRQSQSIDDVLNRLREDIETEFGTKGHVKADALWAMALRTVGYSDTSIRPASIYREYSSLASLLS